MLKQHTTIRTTVTLPQELADRSQRFIGPDAIPSRNALILAALEYYLEELERVEIDEQFAQMEDDADYLALNEQIAESFNDADWESLAEGRKDSYDAWANYHPTA